MPRRSAFGLKHVVGSLVLVGLVYFGLSLGGSLLAEQARQDVVSLQAELRREKTLNQNLRAQVDQLGAPHAIAAWALHHGMVRADTIAMVSPKPVARPAPVRKATPRPNEYAAAGGAIGL
jgi:hypothetical protein